MTAPGLFLVRSAGNCRESSEQTNGTGGPGSHVTILNGDHRFIKLTPPLMREPEHKSREPSGESGPQPHKENNGQRNHSHHYTLSRHLCCDILREPRLQYLAGQSNPAMAISPVSILCSLDDGTGGVGGSFSIPIQSL